MEDSLEVRTQAMAASYGKGYSISSMSPTSGLPCEDLLLLSRIVQLLIMGNKLLDVPWALASDDVMWRPCVEGSGQMLVTSSVCI
jgi:hypothetical protein